MPLPPVWKTIRDSDSVSNFVQQHFNGTLLVGDEETTIWVEEYRIDLDYGLEQYADDLRKLEPLALSIAPTVIDMVVDTDGSCALLTQYAACPGETLRRVSDEVTVPPFKREAVERFERDMIKLYRTGLDHTWALDGFFYTLRSSRTDTIVLDGWESLEPLASKKLDEHIAQLRRGMVGFLYR